MGENWAPYDLVTRILVLWTAGLLLLPAALVGMRLLYGDPGDMVTDLPMLWLYSSPFHLILMERIFHYRNGPALFFEKIWTWSLCYWGCWAVFGFFWVDSNVALAQDMLTPLFSSMQFYPAFSFSRAMQIFSALAWFAYTYWLIGQLRFTRHAVKAKQALEAA